MGFLYGYFGLFPSLLMQWYAALLCIREKTEEFDDTLRLAIRILAIRRRHVFFYFGCTSGNMIKLEIDKIKKIFVMFYRKN